MTTILSGPAEIDESTTVTFTFQADVPGSTYVCWLDGRRAVHLAGHLHRTRQPATTSSPSWPRARQAARSWPGRSGNGPSGTPRRRSRRSNRGRVSRPRRRRQNLSSRQTSRTSRSSAPSTALSRCRAPRRRCSRVLHPGPHQFEVVAFSPLMFDAEGQPVEPLFDPVPATYDWTIIDLVPPDTTITYGPAATTSSIMAYFGFGSDDPTAIIECSLDNQGFSECEVPHELTDLTPGAHTLRARAVDLAGNPDPTPAEHRWTIAPATVNTPAGTNVTVELPIPGSDRVATLTFFEITAPGATTLDVLERWAGAAGRLPHGRRQLLRHQHDGRVRRADHALRPLRPRRVRGQCRAAAALRRQPLDRRHPDDQPLHRDGLRRAGGLLALCRSQPTRAQSLWPRSSPGRPTESNSGTATFEFIADPPGSMVQCSIDGLPFAPCESPVTFTHLEAGDQEILVAGSQPGGADPTSADALRVGGHPASRRNPARHHDHQGSGRATVNFINILRVHR